MANILLLNGPNLNLLGQREADLYGATDLQQVHEALEKQADSLGVCIDCRQTNGEHELIDWVQQAPQQAVDLIIINPGAYTHTSIALRDALLAVKIPFIEVHVSNIHAREAFRHHSYFSDIALGTITGLGVIGYQLALQAAIQYIRG
ncbi:MAG: type II 3-dehydroquinate dehydratase [Legionellales bacterium]|nr:type II 3-dehydroquinate dehydratase [Legionellales bacterium]